MDELTREFLIESTENLDALDRSFVQLEKNPGDRETIASIFRTLHTVKGTSGFFGFNRLENLAHAAENLLGKLRSGELSLTQEITDALLKTADAIRGMLKHIESTGREPAADHRSLVDSLGRLSGAPAQTDFRPSASDTTQFFKRPSAPAVVVKGHVEEPVPAPQPSPVPETKTAPSPAPTAPPGTSSAPVEQRQQSIADTSIRVDVGQLDKLMNLVGELVLARNRLMPFGANHPDTAFIAATQRLNQITSELQERVMKTRMQPIGNLWSKLPRMVRDLANLCGKQISLEFEGQDTELDRSLLEAIKDPLTHIVRNAIDHGIEPPARRAALGKPAAGRLHLRSFHEGGQVVIEISDDGGGIDLARVRQKAVEKGLLTAEGVLALTDRQAMEIIFLPGFSTAEKTTEISGRGVGMDVVKTNIENIGGTLDLQSNLGQGTTLRLRVPLTLAIIPALLVSCRGEKFAIPQTGLVELVRLDGDSEGANIEMVYGAPVVRLRGKLLPLVFLTSVLKLDGEPKNGNSNGSTSHGGVVNIIVLQAESHRFGIVVDDVHDTEEIVVKPLGRLLKTVPCFAGGTILGDGRVALILDVVGLALHSGVVEKIRDRAFTEEVAKPRAATGTEQSLLLFDMGAGERMGIPIEVIARLERFSQERIERSGGGEVAQYHGEILPIVRASEYVAGSSAFPAPVDGVFDVVVVASQGRRVGLVVGRIQDIVSEPLKLQPWSGRRGLIGSAIVQNQVTALLDVPGILREVHPISETQNS
ncbi:MAG: chemotaxis protein CheA [Verrucomicrobia bacterium]|nr:chemotaxis protein CheA [Verrucomicrobiota bacterium]